MGQQKPERIAHIIGKMCAGGVESVVFNYYREMDKDKVQFDFFYDADSTINPPQELLNMGARFIKNPPYQKIWKYIPFLIKQFKKNKYQIIHSHLNTLSVFPLFAAKIAKCPIRIAHNHSVPAKGEFARNLLKKTLKSFSKCFATHYFACSERAGRWLFGDVTFENGKVKVIRNAIDFEKFTNAKKGKEELLEQLKLQNKFIIGHVGRFTYAKNHMFLLEVFSHVKKIKKDAILLLVGDGELRAQIENKIKELNITNDVILVGKTTTPEKYYSIMNIALLPSFFEGIPLTVIEAQAAGVPIIVSKIVSKETQISTGWKALSLEESAEKWANTIVEISMKPMKLTEKSKYYNIKSEVKNLAEWYIERINNL